jgi:aminopeptidase N
VHLRSDFQDGLHYHAAQLSKRWAEQSQTDQNYRRVYGGYQYLLRPKQAWRDYLIYPQRWNVDEANARFTLGFEHNYKMFSGNGNWKIEGWGAGPGSDVKYAAVRYRALHTFKLFDKLKLRTRLFGQYADGNLPAESQLYLAGASPEEYYDNDFFRARGFFPDAMVDNNGGRTTNNIHYGGGLNLRGYAGYEAEFANEDPAYRGSTGGALNLELEFQRLSPWRLHQVFNFLRLKTYAFYDLGVLGTTDPDAPAGDFRGFDPLRFDKIRQDAGLGAALNVNAFDTSADRRPFTIRADFPLLLSNPPATEDFVQFRWMIGIERAF